VRRPSSAFRSGAAANMLVGGVRKLIPPNFSTVLVW
jgi:hypothetical protein